MSRSFQPPGRARRRLSRGVPVIALVLAGGSAVGLSRQRGVLDGVEFRKRAAEQVRLPARLREISGLALTVDGRVFAHGDERAIVSQIDYRRGAIIKSFSLGSPVRPDDFEGLAIVDGRFFLITSTGRLYEFGEGKDGAAVPYTVLDTGLGAVCEIEGLAYEPSDRSLLIGCKQPHDRLLQGFVTVLRWSLDRRRAATPPRVSVPMAAVVRGTNAKGFAPSAIERDAATGHYVVIAGPQSVVTEMTPGGAIVASRPLQRGTHPQPEGIALLGDSVVLIADEGGHGHGLLTAYRRAR